MLRRSPRSSLGADRPPGTASGEHHDRNGGAGRAQRAHCRDRHRARLRAARHLHHEHAGLLELGVRRRRRLAPLSAALRPRRRGSARRAVLRQVQQHVQLSVRGRLHDPARPARSEGAGRGARHLPSPHPDPARARAHARARVLVGRRAAHLCGAGTPAARRAAAPERPDARRADGRLHCDPDAWLDRPQVHAAARVLPAAPGGCARLRTERQPRLRPRQFRGRGPGEHAHHRVLLYGPGRAVGDDPLLPRDDDDAAARADRRPAPVAAARRREPRLDQARPAGRARGRHSRRRRGTRLEPQLRPEPDHRARDRRRTFVPVVPARAHDLLRDQHRPPGASASSRSRSPGACR